MNRKQRRKAEENGENPDLQEKLLLFGKMGNKCTGCQINYDKKNREHVTTWSVTVYAQSERVDLYCPECWTSVKAYLEDEARGLFNG